MSHSITLSTRDDQQFEFSCEDEQNLQAAAEAAGYFPPAMCKEGSCGACFGHCDSGEYRLGNHSDAVLSAEAAARGDILLCQTYPDNDLHISLPYEASRVRLQQNPPREAQIIALEKIAERTVQLVLQLDDNPETGLAFEFEPGQYAELEIPDRNIKRAYSLANTPNWEGRLEFLIRLQPNGQFSEFLQHASCGQKLMVSGPSGAFGIQSQNLNPRCFVAGGTGVAPFISILKRMAEWGENHSTRLFFGVNIEAEIFCQNELTEIQQSIPDLSLEICVWKPEQNWQGYVGTPAEALQNYLQSCETLPDIYVCGPPQLVEAANAIALQNDIPEERIFSERFVS